MKNKIIFMVVLLIFPLMISAYEVNLEWKKSYGDVGTDNINKVIDDGNGGFVVVGSTNLSESSTYSSQNAFIAKYDSDGELVWKRDFSGDDADNFSDVVKLADGNYIVAGSSHSTDIEGITNNVLRYALLLKYDSSGNLLWIKNFDGLKEDAFFQTFLVEDGIIVLGTSNSDNFLGMNTSGYYDDIVIKFDFDGNIIWKNKWGSPDIETGYSDILNKFKIDKNGNLYAVGFEILDSDIEGISLNYNGVILKYDKDGNLLWEKSYDSMGGEFFNSFVLEDDGSIVCFGEMEYFDYENAKDPDGYHGIIVKYDRDGNLLWENEWIVDDSELAEMIASAIKLSNGNYLVKGYLTDLVCDTDCYTYVVQFDKDGNLIYEDNLGNNTQNDPVSYMYIFPDNNGYFVSYSGDLKFNNSTGSALLRYDNNGELSNYYIYSKISSNKIDDMLYLDDGSLLLKLKLYSAADGLAYKGKSDYAFYKYTFNYNLEKINSVSGDFITSIKGNKVIVTPNPDKGYEVDKIIVKDKDGNVLDVEITKLEDGTYSFKLYTDISVDVIFREKIENPKTFDFPDIMICFSFLIICLSAYYYLYSKNNVMEF